MNAFLETIKSKLFPQRIAVVKIYISKESTEGSAMLMESKNGSLEVYGRIEFKEDWKSLLKEIPKSYPVLLIINGKGVLHKIHPSQEEVSSIANQLFPNIRQSDFYFQQTQLTKGMVVSLIKNETVSSFQKTINEAQLQMVGVSLGAFDLAKLFLLDDSIRSAQGLHQELLLDNQGQIISFSNNSATSSPDRTYQFGDLSIHQNELVEFASGFKYLMEAYSNIQFDGYQEQLKEYQYGQAFRKLIPNVLGLLFFVLIINTFLFYKWKDNTELNQAALFNSQQKMDEIKVKKASLDLQTKIFKETGANKVSTASFYADRIGANLPKELKLTELDIFPAVDNNSHKRRNEIVKYQNDQIKAKGICTNSRSYNSWLKQLEAEDWVSQVKHENYKDINQKTSEFQLTIELSDLNKLK